MKAIEWATPNKMKIDTGHKSFDRQTNVLMAGNIIANTQFGWHIRPYSETECNGYTFEPGHLRRVDLGYFTHLPHHVRQAVIELTATEAVWLYQFYHYSGKRRIVHGYLITAKDHTLLKTIVTGDRYRSAKILAAVTPYVSTPTKATQEEPEYARQ
jgi:hypothetical protein